MYRFDAEDPGQSLYTPTTVGVIIAFLLISHTIYNILSPFFENNSPFAYSSLKYHQISNEVHSESKSPNLQS